MKMSGGFHRLAEESGGSPTLYPVYPGEGKHNTLKKMTLIEQLRNGNIPPGLKKLAKRESVKIDDLTEKIISGKIVVCGLRTGRGTMAVGRGMRTKVNANIGASTLVSSLDQERKKLRAALEAGAHAVMDLSLCDNLGEIRKMVLNESKVPVGTVPVYEAATVARKRREAVVNLDLEEFFEIIEKQLDEGVDFITVHTGVVRRLIEAADPKRRIEGIVSRGGAITAAYMKLTGNENPLYAHFDRLVHLAARYDAVLSLGDGMRPGAIADAADFFEISEQEILGDLQKRALAKGVMTMIEGPGHVPLHKIGDAVKRIKRLTNNAPLYLLGPIVTDVAPGYDHITSAIGASVAGMNGADFICYVTPAEHLGLPVASDVYKGVITARIAAHAADIAKGLPGAENWDLEMSKARRDLNWDRQMELALDRRKAKKLRKGRSQSGKCSMCGEYCAFVVLQDTADLTATTTSSETQRF